jgi:hypothetical protein
VVLVLLLFIADVVTLVGSYNEEALRASLVKRLSALLSNIGSANEYDMCKSHLTQIHRVKDPNQQSKRIKNEVLFRL